MFSIRKYNVSIFLSQLRENSLSVIHIFCVLFIPVGRGSVLLLKGHKELKIHWIHYSFELVKSGWSPGVGRCSVTLGWAGQWRYVTGSTAAGSSTAPDPHPLLDVSSVLQASTRHFCNEDGSLHLLPRESSSLCPLRPFLPRVAIKELIHFTGLCYSGGSSPCTQQASSLLSGQQRWQKPRYRIYNFIHIFFIIAD